jgi:leader peptidase (prepilin peptidase)/N-methyltransferase
VIAAWCLGVVALVVGALATRTDLARREIPNQLTGAGALAAVAVGLVVDPGAQPARLAAGAGAAGLLLGAALLRPGGMGLGDVKLAGVLGLCLGPIAVALALVIAFALGTLYGLRILIWDGLSTYRTATLAFGPCLALGGAAGVAVTVL